MKSEIEKLESVHPDLITTFLTTGDGEVIEIHASTTHDDYQVILARCRNISLLCRSRKCRNIVCIEEISLQGVGGCRLKRHCLDFAVFIWLREGLR